MSLPITRAGSGPAQALYHKRDDHATHSDFGGVTTSSWHFVHLTRTSHPHLFQQAIMMPPQFSCPLQTALQDTIGAPRGKTVVVEKVTSTQPLSGTHVIGMAHFRGTRSSPPTDKCPIFDANGLAPVLGKLARDRRAIWVSANSVYGRRHQGASKKPAIRPIIPSEILAIWDYEGKYESTNWSSPFTSTILNLRL